MALGGALRIVSEGELQAQDALREEEAREALAPEVVETNLANYIRKTFETFRRHKSSQGINDQLIAALRAYNGEYDEQKKREIAQFGGSDVFARLTSVKCRGASAILRDIYLAGIRPWSVESTPTPDLPDHITQSIDAVVDDEAAYLQQKGVAPDPQMLAARRMQLREAATRAGIRQAKKEAHHATTKLDDLLVEGGFYQALYEFIIDLPIFRFAVIKGPVVQNVTDLKWVEGKMQVSTFPRMFWYRVSPFDLYFSPGASSIEDTDVIERIRLRRSELNALIGVPGYDEEAIRDILREYPEGFVENHDTADAERADMEERENPVHDTGWYDALEFHGSVQGQMLLDYGLTEEDGVADAELDYFVTLWLLGRRVLKVQLDPNPRKRVPYYVSSYEKVPGSLIGHALPDIIADIQDVANATLRSLVNNLSISSGPQVAVNEDRLSPTTDANTLYPWKRWRFVTDPMATSGEKPIDFFQPQSNAQELLQVFQNMSNIADEVSAIPRYITGSEKVGGAARTASGLSMLMGNASKVLQMVAANIDHDILNPVLQVLYDTVMLTDETGSLRGDENIVVRGVSVAMQKDADRMRRLEFLQITANPIDQNIVGVNGRAAILRTLAEDLGMPEASVVPSEEELQAQQQHQQQAMQAAQLPGSTGDQPPAPREASQAGLGEQTDNQFRARGPEAM